MSEVTEETTRALCLLNEENEQLQTKIKEFERMSVCELGAVNPNVMSYMRHWESRATEAEARVKELEGKLTWANSQWDRCVKRIKELEAELRNKKCEPHCGIITRCEELEELVRKLEVCQ